MIAQCIILIEDEGAFYLSIIFGDHSINYNVYTRNRIGNIKAATLAGYAKTNSSGRTCCTKINTKYNAPPKYGATFKYGSKSTVLKGSTRLFTSLDS